MVCPTSFYLSKVLPAKSYAAQKGPELKPKKSWFGGVGGWLGGKKEDNLGQEPKAIKAKLGEESSFYFDKDLNRWINKKAGVEAVATSPTPPPPKGPPSRAVSAAGGPPPPSSRNATPPVPPLPSKFSSAQTQAATPPINVTESSPATSPPQAFGPPSGAGTPARAGTPAIEPPSNEGTNSGPPSGPPSRPQTAASGTSAIDDLIGAPQARKGGTIKKGKKGRGYVDVMAK